MKKGFGDMDSLYEDLSNDPAHEESFAEFSEGLVTTFAKIPLVAVTNTPMGARYYGPFANGKEASDWLRRQPSAVRLYFIPLRLTGIKRTEEDFWSVETDNAEGEFIIPKTEEEHPQMVFYFD